MKTYRPTAMRRLGNTIMSTLVSLGIGPRSTYLLTVSGRRTGRPRTTPVMLVENERGRWLVAPYGPVGWVHNTRAAGQVRLRRGPRLEDVQVVEVDATEAAPVLKEYVSKVRIVRPYFDASHTAPAREFAAEAKHHPVFRIQPAG